VKVRMPRNALANKVLEDTTELASKGGGNEGPTR
jgi:hypothetical protein